jgi:hypothetical protein
MLVMDFMNVVATLSSSGSANFTIKFQWSTQDSAPDFATAQSPTNKRDYIQVKDYQNNSSIDGDTWISFAGTDDVRIVEWNTNWLKWIWATITARVAGAINLSIVWFDNQ